MSRSLSVRRRSVRRATLLAGLAVAVPLVFANSSHAAVICVDPGPGVPVQTTPGTTPRALASTFVGQNSVSVSWALPFGCNPQVTQYRITLDGQPVGVQSATGPLRASISGLVNNTTYVIGVSAIDETGAESAPATVQVHTTTQYQDDPRVLGDFVGPAVLYTATPSIIALTGFADLPVGSNPSGLFDGFGGLSGRLSVRAAGVFPITATVQFDNNGAIPFTGSILDHTLRLSAQPGVKFRKVMLYGIDLLGGRYCGTVSPSTFSVAGAPGALDLNSTAPFKMTGTMTLPKTSGCGYFGSLIAPTAKPNTVSLTFTPRRPVLPLPPTGTPNPTLEPNRTPNPTMAPMPPGGPVATPTPAATPTPMPMPTPTPSPVVVS
jgi:hypothetical protein